MKRIRGFTLIELMVVVAIIAILAAIAVPAYGRYAYRARRAEGQELLLRLASAQERYYSTNNAYFALATANTGFSSTTTSEKGYYLLSSITLANGGYTASATPQNAQATDKCLVLSIADTGAKTFSGDTTNGNCW
ncbi:type IV pilin protein [Dyella tabacisoli]|uniref:Prepilin-type N-terminal cleavage/methylation domain-containing protein n=1 Tax=Dyella tabacisoli TaxID=2282381 RepID=A0A369UJQ9_9GAMM|nr:type IV pilin protein [Dyella tabacisoli]RDD79958.1 prepilin-type N-terminal cleavage/methylation domain-containing protein [Dyella tabacisoli]